MPATRLRVWFYTPQSPTEPTVNRLVAQADGPFCHCEVQFKDDWACTLYMGSPAVMRKRAFSSPNYSCRVVPCSPAQERACRECAERAVQAQIPFAVMRMVNAFCRVPLIGTPLHGVEARDMAQGGVHKLQATGSFCSELVTMVLQAGAILPITVSAAHVSPSGLARLLPDASVPETPVHEARGGVCKESRSKALGFRSPSAALQM